MYALYMDLFYNIFLTLCFYRDAKKVNKDFGIRVATVIDLGTMYNKIVGKPLKQLWGLNTLLMLKV